MCVVERTELVYLIYSCWKNEVIELARADILLSCSTIFTADKDTAKARWYGLEKVEENMMSFIENNSQF
jgi:hypothetical protein